MLSLTLPDGSSISYTYDPLYLKSVTRHSSEGKELYTHHYTNYDLNGNLLAEQLIGSIGELQHTYDLAGRKTSVTSPTFAV